MELLWVIGFFLLKPVTWVALLLLVAIVMVARRAPKLSAQSSDGHKLLMALTAGAAYFILPRWLMAVLVLGFVIWWLAQSEKSSKATTAPHSPRKA